MESYARNTLYVYTLVHSLIFTASSILIFIWLDLFMQNGLHWVQHLVNFCILMWLQTPPKKAIEEYVSKQGYEYYDQCIGMNLIVVSNKSHFCSRFVVHIALLSTDSFTFWMQWDPKKYNSGFQDFHYWIYFHFLIRMSTVAFNGRYRHS